MAHTRRARRLLNRDRAARALLGLVGRQPAPTPDQVGPRVAAPDEADLRAAFRLLLGREPDEEGRQWWLPRLAQLSMEEMVTGVMDSREFRSGAVCQHLLATAPGAGTGAGTIQVDAVGLKFWIDPTDRFIGSEVARGAYEPHLTPAILAELTPGATFVDVGANIGWYSVLAARAVGAQGRVLAFEPDPENIDLLLRSVTSNGFANVTALPVALSDRTGTAVLQRYGGSNAALFADDGAKGVGDHRVSCLPLDVFGDLLTRLDVMKVDVEGAELLVLRGADTVFSRYGRPVIFLEFTPSALERFPASSADHLGAWVTEYRYDMAVVRSSGEAVAAADIGAVSDLLGDEQHLDVKLTPRS